MLTLSPSPSSSNQLELYINAPEKPPVRPAALTAYASTYSDTGIRDDERREGPKAWDAGVRN